jgi:hypothetical protein
MLARVAKVRAQKKSPRDQRIISKADQAIAQKIKPQHKQQG